MTRSRKTGWPTNFIVSKTGKSCWITCIGGVSYENLTDKQLPGLILLDLNMPRKDGREALKEMKADPILRRIPVVVLTTSKAEEDILRSYDLGVNSYVTKPVTFKSLVELVKFWGNTGLKSSNCRRMKDDTDAAYASAPVRVLLVDDDEDDYVITRDLISQNPGPSVSARMGG